MTTAIQSQALIPVDAARAPQRGQLQHWADLPPTALALALLSVAQSHAHPTVVIARDVHAAHVLEGDLRALAPPELDILAFPDWETLPYDLFGPHPEISSQRIHALYRMPRLGRSIVILAAGTLLHRLPPTHFILGQGLVIARGDRIDLESQRQLLEQSGYRCVGQVEDPGEFAVRGSILDLFPMGLERPVRIELFDDEVDTLRSFDPETQRSLEPVQRIDVLPAREFPLSDEAAREFRNRFRHRFPIDLRRCGLYQDIKEGTTPPGIEYYLPLYFGETARLTDYLPADSTWVFAAGAGAALLQFWHLVEQRHEQRRHDIERPILDPAEIAVPPAELQTLIKGHRRILVGAGGSDDEGRALQFAATRAPNLATQHPGKSVPEVLQQWILDYAGRSLLVVESPGRREALLDLLRPLNLDLTTVSSFAEFRTGEMPVGVLVAALDDGVLLDDPSLALLTDRQLQGERVRQERRRRRGQRDPESILRDLGDISDGTPVVHEDHGVGRYRGLQHMDIGGTAGEFVVLEYARGDKLYVPVTQLQRIARYTGTAPEQAPLHSLGGEQWDKAKRKAAEKVRDVAAELLDLYARREARQGQALSFDQRSYESFAQQFPFEETTDQLQAIQAVLQDLRAARPMDRVVCGDVGFGKTEVALRAAFCAVTAGKQVALLVPTTLLAQQHFQNFRDRLADWPIRVDVLSRFKTGKETQAALAEIADGRLDIVVGTHKLLQADVRFKDLGLVIVDEEHRFGVRQKDQLKRLRAEVDLLTLTATPIPRTLNMALAGMRDLSIIATPPQHRLSVKTFVTPWDSALLREAMEREISRGGQVYYLHNEVDTIERAAAELAELLPEARIRIAHGQMPERELEQVMLDFYRQRFNVLVCSTIIESGIDIPSANTIIIQRADRFGLAQLHQLRGRVGRSHHRAYAYLLVPDLKSISADAKKRLDAIAALEELGAGFTLATHDLEIRGAGELLGEEQSGQIQQIGFSLYTELLTRAVRAIQRGEIPDLDQAESKGAELLLHLAALIPDDYIGDVPTRLTLYKRIAAADIEGLHELKVEMIDRFGLLPEPVKRLFDLAELERRASALGIAKIDLGAEGGRIQFRSNPGFDPRILIELVQRQAHRYRFDGPTRLRLRMSLPEASDRLDLVRDFLQRLEVKRAA